MTYRVIKHYKIYDMSIETLDDAIKFFSKDDHKITEMIKDFDNHDMEDWHIYRSKVVENLTKDFEYIDWDAKSRTFYTSKLWENKLIYDMYNHYKGILYDFYDLDKKGLTKIDVPTIYRIEEDA